MTAATPIPRALVITALASALFVLLGITAATSAAAQDVGPFVVTEVFYEGDQDCAAPDGPGRDDPIAMAVATWCLTVTNVGDTVLNNVVLDPGRPELGLVDLIELGDLQPGESITVRQVIDRSSRSYTADPATVPPSRADADQRLAELVVDQVVSRSAVDEYNQITDVDDLIDRQDIQQLGGQEVDADLQLLKWETLGIDTYEMVWRPRCFCAWESPGPPYTVRVVDGEVTSVLHTTTGQPADEQRGLTIDELFADIAAADSAPAYVNEAEFHALLGYPTRWFVDRVPNIADDEYTAIVESLTPLTGCLGDLVAVGDCQPRLELSVGYSPTPITSCPVDRLPALPQPPPERFYACLRVANVGLLAAENVMVSLAPGEVPVGIGDIAAGDELLIVLAIGIDCSRQDSFCPAPSVHDSCLAGRGRFDVNVVNHSTEEKLYEVRYGTLSPRRVQVPAGGRGRVSITGRANGEYPVEILDAGRTVLRATSTVDCGDAAPAVDSSAITVIPACLNGDGHITVQFVNGTASRRTWFLELSGLPRRSATTEAHGAAIHGISGRADGTYELVIRPDSAQSGPIYIGEVAIDCDSQGDRVASTSAEQGRRTRIAVELG